FPARFYGTVIAACGMRLAQGRHLREGNSLATATVQVRPASRLRPKYFVFGLVGLMIAYVIQHNESFLWHHDDPVWQHYQPFKWYLLPHGLAGACAILLGPLQFSDRLRQRYTKLHRVSAGSTPSAHSWLRRLELTSSISTNDWAPLARSDSR